MRAGQIEIREHSGVSVLDLVSDARFCKQWDALYAACPWATTFQSHTFTAIWYSVYEPAYDPLLLTADNDAGLSGLIALAVDRQTGALVNAGGVHAEYTAWLSIPAEGDSFIEAALDHLANRFPDAHLQFQFLAPGCPLGWIEPRRPWAGRARVRSVARPLMKVGEGGSVERSLRKKSNKSRASRLQRRGPVSFDQVRSRKGIEPVFESIIEFCDLRHGAMHRSLPFREDPLKKEFYLRLIDSPDVCHATILRSGSDLVAAHVGVRNGTSVQLGLIVHSPLFAEYSPGKLLLLYLGRHIGEEGFQYLDLTPGGLYKDRFADHYDQVNIADIFFRHSDARRHDVWRLVVRVVRFLLARTGITPDMAGNWLSDCVRIVRSGNPPALMASLVRWIARRIRSRVQLDYYCMRAADAALVEPDPRFNRDSIGDLLLYEQATPADRTPFRFLREALNRLESGGHAFTVSDGKRLLHCSWVMPAASLGAGAGKDSCVALPPDAILLCDDYTHPSCRGIDLHLASIRHRQSEAASLAREGSLFINAPAGDERARRNIENAGFRLYATAIGLVRFGRVTWEWEHRELRPHASPGNEPCSS